MAKLTEAQILILYWLWMMPWASAKNLVMVTGLTEHAISTFLKRNPHWVGRYKVGMLETAAFRYFFLPTGLKAMSKAFGWQIQWWHTVQGLRWLLVRLQVLECCYKIIPGAWDSQLVRDELIEFRPDLQWGMVRVNQSQGVLKELRWYQDSQIPLVARYWVEDLRVDVYLPVALFGPYRRPREVRDWQERVGLMLVGEAVWEKEDCGTPPFPLVVVASDEALGVKARVIEGWHRFANAAIVDLKGNVVEMMHRHVPVWKGFATDRTRPRVLGDPKDLKKLITESLWSALLTWQGRQTLYWVHDFPNTTQDQGYRGCKIGKLALAKAVECLAGLKLLKREEDGLYPGAQGLVAIAEMEGCHVERVRRRWKRLLESDEYRLEQSVHNREAAEAAVYGIEHGIPSYSALHAFFDFQGLTQVKGDVLYKVRLPGFGASLQGRNLMPQELVRHMDAGRTLAMFLVGEVERRAGVRASPDQKMKPFYEMKLARQDMAGVFIAESDIAAYRLLVASPDLPVWVTTWERMKEQGFENCWRTSSVADCGHWAEPIVPTVDVFADTPFHPLGLAADCPLLWLFKDLKVPEKQHRMAAPQDTLDKKETSLPCDG